MKILFILNLFFSAPEAVLQDDTIFLCPAKTVVVRFGAPITSAPIPGSPDILMNYDGSKVMLSCEAKFAESNLYVETENGHHSFVVIFKPTIKKTVYYYEGEGDVSILNTPKEHTVNSKPAPKTAKSIKKEKIDITEGFKKDCEIIATNANRFADYGEIKKGMVFSLNDLYVKDNYLYFKVTATNTKNIKYDIDFYKLVVRNNKGAVKKAAVQEDVITPVYIYNEAKEVIEGKEKVTKVFVCNKFTIADKKKLYIELWEKNGDRLLEASIDSDELIRAKLLQ